MKRNPSLIQTIGRPLILLALLLTGLATVSAAVLKEDYPGASFGTAGGNTAEGTYTPTTTFTVGGTLYTMSDNPNRPTFQDDPSSTFMNLLLNQTSSLIANGTNLTFGALYNFNVTGKDLTTNDLVVKSYATHVANTDPTTNRFDESFYVQNAGGTISGTNVHWIQALVDNWKLNTAPGTADSKIDNGGPGAQADPYYDTGGDASSSYLFDDPNRRTALVNGTSVYFNFETFLVYQNSTYTLNDDGTVKTKGSVDIYDGVLWGFTLVPEPGTASLLILGLGAWALRRRSQARG